MVSTEATSGITEEAAELWVKSYQGEVLGEAYFGRMATYSEDPQQRANLEMLTTLERCTKELLAPCLDRLGISTVPDPAVLEGVANSGTDFDYRGMLEMLPAVTAEYLNSYARLRQLVEPVDATVVDLLIAHEMALELFARRELTGDVEHSLDPIRALSHVSL